MPPKSKVWPRDPHTEGKHLVLRRYLNAWLPILSRWNKRIVFVDGFAGPGEYVGGEEGSPLVAIRALCEHGAKIGGEVIFYFVESRPDRCEHLRALVEEKRTELPENAKVRVVEGEFDTSMTEVLDKLDEQSQRLAPALVMIDPFGVTGTPMKVIERILKNRQCEVYISFMFNPIKRFLRTPEFEDKLDSLFGTPEWRGAAELSGEEKRTFLYDLYKGALKRAGAKHVVHFDLYEGRRLVYSIFFGTKHHTGCDRMKAAIWSVVPFGDFAFRGGQNFELELGGSSPDFDPLRQALCAEFADQGWVDVQRVLDFVSSDATEYHMGQVRRPVLKPMEQEGLIEVDRKGKWGYPKGTRIRFRCGSAAGHGD